MSDEGLSEVGRALLETARELDPDCPHELARNVEASVARECDEEGNQLFLSVALADKVLYCINPKTRLWRLDQRAGRTDWRVLTGRG
jgi:hypothetical protein